MRLRELTPDELSEVADRRVRVRETLALIEAPWVPDAAAVDAAPFLHDWEISRYPGTDRPCLRGLCWGHPDLGDTAVTTSVVLHQGAGWAITKGSDRLYVLGREHRQQRRARILSGRRGAYRPHPQPTKLAEGDDDLPPIEPDTPEAHVGPLWAHVRPTCACVRPPYILGYTFQISHLRQRVNGLV